MLTSVVLPVIFTLVVVAAVAVGELLIDDSVLQARSDPADLSLDGGDDDVGGSHGPVTGLTALG